MKWRLGAIALAAVASAGAQAPAALRLERCAPAADAPCLRARFELPAGSVSASDSATEAAAWGASLRGAPLIPPGAVSFYSSRAHVAVLVLIDRGSAMSGEGMAFTRSALKSWFATLDPSVRVAVAGVEVRDVRRQVDAAVFGSPRDAAGVLDAMPAPDAGARSAVYSAAAFGAGRLSSETRSPGGTGLVLLVGTGRNDPVRGRDAGEAFEGPGGLAAAARLVEVSQQKLDLVVLSAADTAAGLATLAGERGVVTVVPRDPNALAARFNSIGRAFITGRELTFGINGANAPPLARTPLQGAATLGTGSSKVVQRLEWRPPLMALPALRGVAGPGSIAPVVREALLIGANSWSNRYFIFALMLLVIGSVWTLIPRIVWQELPEPSRPRSERTATTSAIAAGAGAPALPRKPEDITHQTARRTAMHR